MDTATWKRLYAEAARRDYAERIFGAPATTDITNRDPGDECNCSKCKE